MSEAIFRIYETNDLVLLHNLEKSKVISIDKTYLSISAQGVEILNESIILSVQKAFGILGIIQIGVCDFLTYVKSADKACNIGSTEIFEIKEVDFIFLSAEKKAKPSNEIVSILNSLRKLFKEGFYYSHHYDLTNSLQNQKIIKINNQNKYDFMRNANKNFLWNARLCTKFFDYNVDNDFMINCICGFVGMVNEKIDEGHVLNYVLISRRPTQNAGIKTFKRGIDKEGNVANFVESEQILILNQNVFSYVQVRGNPPVFYNKFQTLSNQNQFNPNTDPLPALFEKHLKTILETNNSKLVFIINLMNSLVESEQSLTDTYERIIQQKNFKFLKYSYFDLENECAGFLRNNLQTVTNATMQNAPVDVLDFFSQPVQKECNINNLKEDQIELFLNKMESIFHIFKFFGIFYTNNANSGGGLNNKLDNNFKGENNVSSSLHNNSHNYHSTYNTHSNSNPSKVLYDQIGILRVNCFDCLEKCNTLQMRVGWKILLIQLGKIQIDAVKLFGNNFLDDNDDVNMSSNKNNHGNLLLLDDIIEVTNQISNKIDLINTTTSHTITNTDHQTSQFLKNFKKLWESNGIKLAQQYRGASKSNSSSYYTFNGEDQENKNSYDDSIKQRSIDILLQKYDIKINTVDDELIKKELFNHIDEYTVSEELNVFIGSWNVGGQNLKDEIGLHEWLLPKTKLQKTPDIYCIGLQEIVELNANYLLLSSNQPRVDYWKNTIKRNLDAIDNYTMIKCLNLVGVFMIFFIKTSLKDKIRNFDHMIIKTGLMGAMGNKGSCLIRFNYLDTAFAFSCGHFAAGSSANASRVSEMIDILNKNFPLHKELRFKEHNAAFIFGDLNFRIDLEYNTCIKAINNRALSQLSHYDQFLKSREVNINLFDIEEGPLNFNPTYKYVVGSQEYDFKRKRVPSWCDRVLYKKSRFINQIAYNRAEFSISDHRPIYALFNIHTVKELSDKKSNIIREIKQNLILGINPNSLDNFEVVNSHSIKKTFNFESEPEEKSKCSQPHSHSHSHSQNDLFLSNHRGSTDLTEEKKSESEIVSFFK